MLTLDAHIDLPWIHTKWGPYDFTCEQPPEACRTMDIPKMRHGGLSAFFAALYLPDSWQDTRSNVEVIELLLEQLNRFAKAPFSICKVASEAEAAIKNKLVPIFLGMEGGRMLGTNLNHLDVWAKFGVKYLTLTHNRNTAWANSATDTPNKEPLGEFGVEVLRRLRKLGMWVDVSHAHDTTITAVLHHWEGSVVATHSGVRKLVDNPRNLPDEFIDDMDMIGVPYAKRFMGKYKVADHIDYIVQTHGDAKRVGIGSDLDGAVLIDECRDASRWDHWMYDLSKMGYSDVAIADIGGGNWLRLLK